MEKKDILGWISLALNAATFVLLIIIAAR